MKTSKTSIVALVLSILPFLSLIPMAKEGNFQSVWAFANIVFIIAAFAISISQVINVEKRNGLAIVAAAISGGLIILAVGCIVLALLITFLQ